MKNFKITETHILLFICIVGFFLRLGWALVSEPTLRFDEPRYWAEANNLLKSDVFFDGAKYAHDMPLTAFIFAGFMKLTGAGLVGCKILLVLVSTATIYIIGRLAYSLVPTRFTLFLGASLAAIYPFFIYYSSLILSETFFVLVVSLYFLQLFNEGKTQNGWILGGLTGLSHYIRPTLMYFVPITWFWQVVIMKVPIRKATLVVILFIIMIIPWGVRNQKMVGQFVVGTTGLGMVLLDGNNEWNTTGGTTSEIVGHKIFIDDMPKGLNEIEQNEWQKRKAVTFIKENPIKFIELGWKKFLRFWHLWPNYHLYQDGFYKWLSLLSFGPILILSLFSLGILRNEWKKTGTHQEPVVRRHNLLVSRQ